MRSQVSNWRANGAIDATCSCLVGKIFILGMAVSEACQPWAVPIELPVELDQLSQFPGPILRPALSIATPLSCTLRA